MTNDAAVDFSPFWSPDGSHLYFGSDRGGSFNLWRIAIDESSGEVRGAPEPVTVPITWAGTFAGSFRGSRNGRRIAFTSPAELMTIERLTLDPKTLEPQGPPVVLRRSSTAFEDIAISPDGATLATRTVGRVEDLCLISADGQKLRRLTHDGFRNRGPAFTTDGARVVFYSTREGDYGDLFGRGRRQRRRAPHPGQVALLPLSGDFPGREAPRGGVVRHEARHLPADREERDSRRRRGRRPVRSPVGRGTGRPGAIASSRPVRAASSRSRRPSVRSRRSPARASDGRAYFALFGPDGRRAVAATPDGIRVFDLATKQSRLVLPAEETTLTRIALSRDGRSLYFLRNVTESDVWIGTFK